MPIFNCKKCGWSGDAKHPRCPKCACAAAKRWRDRNPDKVKSKKCLDCPARIDRKATYCPACARRGERNARWKGDETSPIAKRKRAQLLYKLGKCELCPEPATDRHHRDGNTGNNVLSNISLLCRRCHMVVDGRIQRLLVGLNKGNRKPPEPCVNCQRLTKIRRKGRCGACAMYFRNHGVDCPPNGLRPRREQG
jgi:hypothetical protein